MKRFYVIAYPASLLILALGLSPRAGLDTGKVEDVIDDEKYEMFLPPGYGNSGVLNIKGRMYIRREGSSEFIKEVPFPKIKRPISSLVGFFPHSAKEEPVTIRADGVKKKVKTDDGGYFSAALQAPPGIKWKGTTEVKLVARDSRFFRETIYIPNPDSKLGIISDIDDTVKITGVHKKSKVVGEMLFGSAETDEPVPGMDVLYTDIARSGEKGPRPFHYVSASPYALSHRIVEFLSINHFPSGSLDLMKLDLAKDAMDGIAERIIRYKETAIKKLFATFPGRKFLLFGDSGQEDPKIYSRLFSLYPEHVEAIYVRKVKDGKAMQTDYPRCLFFTSPDEVRMDLVKKGIIRRD